MTNLSILLFLTFIINLPFGYWRGGVKKFSWQWFVAIHLPVVFLYFMRTYMHVERTWITLPIMLLCFFAGQFIGKKWRQRKIAKTCKPNS